MSDEKTPNFKKGKRDNYLEWRVPKWRGAGEAEHTTFLYSSGLKTKGVTGNILVTDKQVICEIMKYEGVLHLNG